MIEYSTIIISRKDNIEPFLRFSGDMNPVHYQGEAPKRLLDEFNLVCDEQDFIISPGMNTLLHLEDMVNVDEKITSLEVAFEYPLVLSDKKNILRKKEKTETTGPNQYTVDFFVNELEGEKRIMSSTVKGGPKGNYIDEDKLFSIFEKDKLKNHVLLESVPIDKKMVKDFIASYSKDIKININPCMFPACFFPTAMLSLVENNDNKYRVYAKQSLQFNHEAVYKSFSIYGKVTYAKKGFYRISLAALNERNIPIVTGEALTIEREFKRQ